MTTTITSSALALLMKVFPTLTTKIKTILMSGAGIAAPFVATGSTSGPVASPQVKKVLGLEGTNVNSRKSTPLKSVNDNAENSNVAMTPLRQAPSTPIRKAAPRFGSDAVSSSKTRRIRVLDNEEKTVSPIRAVRASNPALHRNPAVSTLSRDGFRGLLFSAPAVPAVAGTPAIAPIVEGPPVDASLDPPFDYPNSGVGF